MAGIKWTQESVIDAAGEVRAEKRALEDFVFNLIYKVIEGIWAEEMISNLLGEKTPLKLHREQTPRQIQGDQLGGGYSHIPGKKCLSFGLGC